MRELCALLAALGLLTTVAPPDRVEIIARTAPWSPDELVATREPGQQIGLRAGALLGEVAFSAPWSDFRGRTIAAGRYALRYALQPRLKDHVGADAIRDFALLVPLDAAATDWIAASRRVSGSSHPAVMALLPWAEEGASPAGPVERGDCVVEFRTIGDLVVGFVVAGRAPPAEAF